MTKKKNNRQRQTAWLALGVSALFPSLAVCAPWEYGMIADLGVIHTDNLFLEPDGSENSDTVFTLAPEFFLRKESERTNADIRYRPEAFFYSDFNDADDVYHVLDASVTQSLYADSFFLYLSGLNFQSIVTPDNVVPTTNLPVTSNRVDSRILEVRPFWQQRLRSTRIYLEAAYRDLDYDDEQFQSAEEASSEISVDNFAEQQGLAWGIAYNFRRMEYDESPPFEYHRAGLNLGIWVSDSLRIFGVGGAESSFDDYFDANMDADFWEAGFQFAPSDRLNLEVASGERAYGTSYRGDFSYELRRGTLSMSYTETPTNRAEAVFQNRPIVSANPLDDVLNRPGNTDRFIRKRGDLRLSIELPKSELTVTMFTENQDERTTATGVPLQDERMSGGLARWEWAAGAKTRLEFGVDIARRDTIGRKDDITRYEIGVNYQLAQRTSLRLLAMRSRQKGDTTSDLDYTENQVRLLLRLQLP